MENTFILIKPDAYERHLVGLIINKMEQKGFRLQAMKMIKPDAKLIDEHYIEHVSKAWYPGMRTYFLSSKLIAMVWSGKNIISEARRLIGATNPLEADIGTLRGDYGMDMGRNLVHGSDSIEAGNREIKLWFPEGVNEDKGHDYVLIYEK